MLKIRLPHALLAATLPWFACCTTYIKIPVVSGVTPRFNDLMRGGRNIAVVALPSRNVDLGGYGNWTETLQGIMMNALREYGYFRFVDIGSREERLRELAFSRSGLTSTQKAIGNEFAVKGLLYIEIPGQPTHKCRVFTRTVNYCAEEVRDREKERWRCARMSSYQVKTGIVTATIFIKAKLVNLETGRFIAFSRNETGTFSGDSNCPSHLEVFDQAAKRTSRRLAAKISPKVTSLSVPLEDEPAGVPDRLADAVEDLLELGIEWVRASPPNYEKAGALWEKALSASGNTSVGAAWNLAVYHWYSGDMMRAEKYFRQVEAIDNNYMSGDKAKIRAKFEQEKGRLEKER